VSDSQVPQTQSVVSRSTAQAVVADIT